MKTYYLLSNSIRLQLFFMPLYTLLTLWMNYLMPKPFEWFPQVISLILLWFFFNVLLLFYHALVKIGNSWMKMITIVLSTIICIAFVILLLYWLMPESKAFQTLNGEILVTWSTMLYVFNKYLGVLILAGFVFYHIQAKHKQEVLLKVREEVHRKELETQAILYQKELEAKDLENVFLATQIPPHFLHNTLQAMVEDSIVGNPSLAKQLLNLSELMRYKLSCSLKKNSIVLDKEEEMALQRYLAIMQWRYPNMRLAYTVEGEVGEQRMLPTAVLALVENMFKHGVFRNGKHPIRIHRILNKDFVAYRLVNKIDAQSQQPKEQGVGLQNIKRRLELLFEGSYQLNTTIDVDNNFTVFFKINQ